MLDIRFRTVITPPRYARAFESAPDGRLHGVDLRFEPAATSGRMLGFAKDPYAFARDLAALDAPEALEWEPRVVGDHVEAEARWREPYVGTLPSPPRLVRDTLGEAFASGFTMRASGVVHRVLVPHDRPTDPLWAALRETTEAYTEATGRILRIEVERLARCEIPEEAADAEVQRVLCTGFAMGAWESPPAATPREVAIAVGLPPKTVESYLHAAAPRRVRDQE